MKKGWINSNGDFIEITEMDHKAKVYLRWLRKLQIPHNTDIIFHMSPSEFNKWLYVINPRDALIYCSSGVTLELFQRQKNPGTIKLCNDFLWRLSHQHLYKVWKLVRKTFSRKNNGFRSE